MISIIVLSASVACQPKDCQPKEQRLNVLFILSDALRAANLPMYGYPINTSPYLSEFADQAILFTQHFANAPATRWSVSQTFTSRLQPPMLMGTQHRPAASKAIADDLLVLPRVFRNAGYKTYIITSHPWFNHSARVMQFFEVQRLFDRPKRGTHYATYEEVAPAIKEAIDQASAEKKPFFMYVHTMDTHSPFEYRKDFDSHSDTTSQKGLYVNYDSEIRYSDHWVHEILVHAEEKGLFENTLILITSDHGEEFGEMGRGWWNKTHGGNLRTAALHVPLILRLPGKGWRTGQFEALSQHIDLAPTLATLAIPGVDLFKYHYRGRDLSESLRSGTFGKEGSASVFSRNFRFWSLRQSGAPGIYALYDTWSGEVEIFRTEVTRLNYPRPVKIPEKSRYSFLENTLIEAVGRYEEEFEQTPRLERKATSKEIGLGRVVPMKGRVVPSLDDDSGDGRWYLRSKLSCGPSENPGPITLSQPTTPGTYRVWVRLDPKAWRKGYRNQFKLRFGSSARPVDFPLELKKGGALLDAGVRTIGDRFEYTIDGPSGGVSILGFKLEVQGAGEEQASAPTVDPALTERLMGLGYVE